jgi:hypothetical protein
MIPKRWSRVLVALALAAGVVLGAVGVAHAATLTKLYNYDYYVTKGLGGAKVKSTPSVAFRELRRCFNCTFPVPGAPRSFPKNGQRLPLVVPPKIPAPVRAYSNEKAGTIRFVAQPGHFDGAGSVVTFRFYTDRSGYLHLRVTGEGAKTNWVKGKVASKFNAGGARGTWKMFAYQLGAKLAGGCPDGGIGEAAALCLFDGTGLTGRMLRFRSYGCQNLGPTWGFDNRTESYDNNTYHRAVLYYGPNCTGKSVAAPARSASNNLGPARNQISSIRIFR